ncbi:MULTISPECIES: magnesium transporter CorA family protein [Heyndrickxia]|uniref:magnesium transporter CorA family protein n=1 Tax=Heyndrickxia TaxID=2837504 RepID=UPI001B044F46|nr:magnesium transporter CorA family protein [Heyndrickxia oleronia]GIN40651.1 magnesium transport protein CorA [Heyndrickxia oleronia]
MTTSWKWYQFKKNEIDQIKQIIEEDSYSLNKEWLNQVKENRKNILRIEIHDDNKRIVKGSLIYKQNFKDEQDYKIFHFYLTHDQFIAVDLDLSVLKRNNKSFLLAQIDRADNAIDGFLIIIGELMNEMLYGIDRFEDELKKMTWHFHKKNETSILDKIYKRRHELLVWKSLLIPVKELKIGIEEAFLEDVNKGEIFKRTCKRIERAIELINEYEHEIDSIINLEEVISSHRGNEIMKTLTVITTIFTPLMALGALWGMNFKSMPELEWKYGYLLSLLLIVVSTIGFYGYLKMKGWTGDLLKSNKKGSFFK